MLCDKCGQNEATVKFVQIENNKKTELHLCRDCAQGYTSFSPGFDLQQLLSSGAVQVWRIAVDGYGRSIARVVVNGADLSVKLRQEGYGRA